MEARGREVLRADAQSETAIALPTQPLFADYASCHRGRAFGGQDTKWRTRTAPEGPQSLDSRKSKSQPSVADVTCSRYSFEYPRTGR